MIGQQQRLWPLLRYELLSPCRGHSRSASVQMYRSVTASISFHPVILGIEVIGKVIQNIHIHQIEEEFLVQERWMVVTDAVTVTSVVETILNMSVNSKQDLATRLLTIISLSTNTMFRTRLQSKKHITSCKMACRMSFQRKFHLPVS